MELFDIKKELTNLNGEIHRTIQNFEKKYEEKKMKINSLNVDNERSILASLKKIFDSQIESLMKAYDSNYDRLMDKAKLQRLELELEVSKLRLKLNQNEIEINKEKHRR